MRAWGYCYIENLTWVLLRPNNCVLALPYRYTNTSHLTLYMFRREGTWSREGWGTGQGGLTGVLGPVGQEIEPGRSGCSMEQLWRQQRAGQ